MKRQYKRHVFTPFRLAELDGPVAYIKCIPLWGPKANEVLTFTIDSEDAERLAAEGWVADALWCMARSTHQNDPSVGRYYMHARIPRVGGTSKPYHRIVTNCPPSKVVDHIDGNTLDNRKSNLRITTTQYNVTNYTRLNRRNRSGVHGVKKLTFKTLPPLYQAVITINKVQHCFPPTPDLEEAARQRRELELKYYGEFAPKKQLRRDDT